MSRSTEAEPVVIPTDSDRKEALGRLAGVIRRTPIFELSAADLAAFGVPAGLRVVLKLELLQHAGSFKARGALNAVLVLREQGAPADGIVTASGGNHGAAIAWAAQRAELPAHVFVPSTSPPLKAERIRSFGAAVTTVEGHYPDALLASRTWADTHDSREIHAYDTPAVVAGASSLGTEIVEQVPDAGAILVSCGGGGLFAGTTLGAGDVRVTPVEPALCPSLHAARLAGGPTPVEVSGLAADSMGAATVGRIAYAVASARDVTSVLVEDAAIRAARVYLWERFRVLGEPGGVTAFAALLSGAWRPDDATGPVVVVVSGGNHPELPEGAT